MSRTAMARALQAHVETLAQAELVRLRKKIARGGCAHSADIERLVRDVATALAARVAAAVERSDPPDLAEAVARLFGVTV